MSLQRHVPAWDSNWLEGLPDLMIGNRTWLSYPEKTTRVENSGRVSLVGIMWHYAVVEMNALLWTGLILVSVMLIKRMMSLGLLWIRGWKLPGPPIQFNWHQSRQIANFNGPDSFTEFFEKLHKEYGPVVRVWLGPTQLLVSVKNKNLVKELLIQAKDRMPATRKAFQLAFGRSSLFFSSFSQAKRRRACLLHEFSGRLLATVHSTSLKVVDSFKSWAEVEDNDWVVDCKLLCQHISLASIGVSIFGEGFQDWPAATEFEETLVKVSVEASTWARNIIAPIWKKEFQTYRATCLRLKDLTEKLVALSRKETALRLENSGSPQGHSIMSYLEAIDATAALTTEKRCSSFAGGFVEDFIAGMLASQEMSAGPFNSVDEIPGHLIGLICHACFATAGILGGILTRLAQHPDIQTKVYEEIQKVCGTNKSPSIAQLKDLHLLFATLYESARLLPISPFLQRCCLEHDVCLGQGVVVPAGSILAVPVQLLQMDSDYWGHDVDTFNPFRFLKSCKVTADSTNFYREAETSGLPDDNGSQGSWEMINSNDSHDEGGEVEQLVFQDPEENPLFLVFGAGSRVCVGKDFAVQNMITTIATVVQRFQIKLAPGAGENLKPKIDNFVLQLSPSPKLVFVPRIRQ